MGDFDIIENIIVLLKKFQRNKIHSFSIDMNIFYKHDSIVTFINIITSKT